VTVLGIDPSTTATGFGVVACEEGQLRVVDFGVIRTSPRDPLPQRLRRVYEEISQLMDRHQPDEFAIEEIFHAENAKLTLKVGQARGVAILAAAMREIPTSEYSPREIKQAVVGHGGASKTQVLRMVRDLLNIPEGRITFDAADALAVAICHCHRRKSQQLKEVNP